ncbi:hypothetical protein Hden_1184 [Hyphomicrobium denitrificans ATCC 51888]|uniref:GapR-like DNA-binding domain-containing protein n=1 Tax=Hyphomicrobium denitrificans (strain ATCC 51888 / DSM 1869 / NCIMB 11706 / TK 0415) TaxID=582899 RepID=D8JVV8_HYPDA|nr:GapR family DNA-binding domain-containing protein [Hyphomicrobium denitrificans]ADJ22997.1 hypothetical protein Hden_1184 [Hyphomicrobium denitrificans ATCC 51888]
MSDEPEILGGNQSADLNSRADQIIAVMDEIDDAKVRLADIKANAKASGYDLKALSQVVKEKRKGAGFQAQQLELEMVLDSYRKAVGNATDLEKAQERARREASEDPDEKKAKRKKSSKVVQFPGGKPN